MTYNFLSPELREIAEEVRHHLVESMGLRKVNMEKPLEGNIEFCPTLSGKSSLGYIVCVEVSESPYPGTLDRFVLDCVTNDIPVKLYVANPASVSGKIDEKEVRRLSKNGVGYMIVGSQGVELIRDALELSLFLPKISPKEIPKMFRPAVNDACKTYRSGSPVKGVAALCDEIEQLIRQIAKKEKRKGRIPSSVKMDFDKARLANVIDILRKYKVIKATLVGRCSALTEIRNDSSHPPRNFRKRIERHKKLKTNFNWSIDLLKDLYKAYRQ